MTKKQNPELGTTLTALLSRMQDRVTSIANNARKAIDGLTTRVEAAEGVLAQRISEVNAKVDTVTINSAKGFVEQKQAIADNADGTSYAFESLKTSTQRALDGVSTDIKSAADCAQRHNARISLLEGAGKTTDERLESAFSRISALEVPTTSQTTSQLEVELKALLNRFGYKTISVGIKKNTYESITTGLFVRTHGSEGIEITLSGSKVL